MATAAPVPAGGRVGLAVVLTSCRALNCVSLLTPVTSAAPKVHAAALFIIHRLSSSAGLALVLVVMMLAAVMLLVGMLAAILLLVKMLAAVLLLVVMLAAVLLLLVVRTAVLLLFLRVLPYCITVPPDNAIIAIAAPLVWLVCWVVAPVVRPLSHRVLWAFKVVCRVAAILMTIRPMLAVMTGMLLPVLLLTWAAAILAVLPAVVAVVPPVWYPEK